MKIRMKMKYVPRLVFLGGFVFTFVFIFVHPKSPVSDMKWYEAAVGAVGASVFAGVVYWLAFQLFFALPLVAFSGMYNSRLNRIHKHH